MKKMSILALAAFSLFGLNLYADGQDDSAKEELVEATETEDNVKFSFSDEEQTAENNFVFSKEDEATTED